MHIYFFLLQNVNVRHSLAIHFSGTAAKLAPSVCAESSGGPQPAEGNWV